MNSREIQLRVEIPSVGCDLCHRNSFTPPGIWTESWDQNKIPPALQLERKQPTDNDPRPMYTIKGCATEDEAEAMAKTNGWKLITLKASIVIVCPDCQALLIEITQVNKSAEQKAAERAQLPYDAFGDYFEKKGQQ